MTKILCLDGMIGSGKSTQIELIQRTLYEMGLSFFKQDELNQYEPLKSLITEWKSQGKPSIDETLLRKFAKIYFQTCRKAYSYLGRVNCLIFDRYIYTPAIFQSEKFFPEQIIKFYENEGVICANLGFILTCNPETALSRIDKRREQLNYNRGRSYNETLEKLFTIKGKYQELCASRKELVSVDTENQSSIQIAREIKGKLEQLWQFV